MFKRLFKKQPQHSTLEIEGLTVSVTRKSIKNLNLKLMPKDGAIKVSAPHHATHAQIESFIRSRWSWVVKHRTAILNRPVKPECLMHEGDCVQVWGRDYRLKYESSARRVAIEIRGDEMVLMAPGQTTLEQRLNALDAFYRMEMKHELSRLVPMWESKMKVKASFVGIKKMKTKWGSCNITHQRVWLSLHLAKAPVECLEYVLVHEFVHFFERYHNARFHGLVEQYLADWKVRDAQLNQISTT